ncbi:hypothetical protein ABB37_03234 [Leptomonas pyrrhocoris]|uniref:Uncharacterized protein n=1 Tax=Leptomonas pyrrhocoris TaxID=157538 RepID=A0A0M9G4I1_LEPPY|nr:hypothetical protein ABB37_03234 [Leptomonas pyrrhocoris]KPA82077.1 hypothetical protein ABB37_03234 [Leptomonas pyrrhocoris]|eukprot:XP_015660516.1 hypothetical protein ABB37_03234 [Leptomonas pyrrhocoris]
MLDSVKTAEEAMERVRAVQQPKERPLSTFFSGLPGSTSNLADLVDDSPSKAPAAPRAMKGGLPATMEEFYECPRYTVSLTAARDAVFSDALSGFHSYVEREKAQRERLRALQRPHPHPHPHQHSRPSQPSQQQNPRAAKSDARGGPHNTLLSFSSGATAEWNAALAAAAPPLSSSSEKTNAATASTSTPATAPIPSAMASSFPIHGDPQVQEGTAASAGSSSEATSTPVPLLDTASPADAPVTGSSTATVATSSAKDGEAGPQHLSASYMFIMRSRDTEALSPVSSPRVKPQGAEFGRLPLNEDKPSAKKMPALEDSVPSAEVQQAEPNDLEAEALKLPLPLPPPPPLPLQAATSAPSKPTSSVATTSAAEEAAKLEEMQLQTLLQERIYQRARVPLVFRCRYALEFAETAEEHRQRVQMRDHVLHNNERLAGPGGLSREMRQRIRDRYVDPNTVAPEWPYVWEQFERDLPRETLFIEDTPHHDAEDALAAIVSYVEYCYDTAQQNIKERSEKLLAAANKESGEAGEAADGTAARDGAELSGSPTAPKSKGFFESILSAGSAAIKGAVATVRSSLPDFVGDPLLAVSGLDPALYHASLLFPTDPRVRSEKIFAAVREVVLASQQSFMGFPYQLLCEQIGTERLGLALEALAMDQENDDDEDDVEENSPADAPLHSSNRPPPQRTSAEVSAPIPIGGADEPDDERKKNASISSCRSSMPSSRVVRIYQSFSSPTLRTDNEDGRRRRGHFPHGIDEWSVSPSSSSSSHASDVVCSPFSPETATGASAAKGIRKANTDRRERAHDTAATGEAENEGEKPRLEAARPPPLEHLVTNHLVPNTAASAPPPAAPATKQQPPAPRKGKLAQRRRERRRRRRGQLPLLVGEPRPHEFAMFLDIVRARVAAKAAKEERRERARRRREQAQRLVERQQGQRHSAPGSRAASRGTSSASLDAMTKTHGDARDADAAAPSPAPAKTCALFREDVEGSAYLLPTHPAAMKTAVAAQMPKSPLSNSLGRQVMPAETRGMRIRLFFDKPRNVPVVVVNKLFRLFTVPGVRGLTSSSEDEAEKEGMALSTRSSAVDGQGTTQRNGRRCKYSEKSLLLLIQVQFSLFTKDETEVRWKWWKV